MKAFDALADPIRRSILERLNRRPASAGEIAGWYDVSRPATSRHLRILREAGLVTAEVDGRHQIYRLETEAFSEIDRWLDQFRDRWAPMLDAMETEVYRTRRERRSREEEGMEEIA